ncbi:hypothetical protein ABZ759_11960 [Streptomyces sp. NPDC047860]|uniref:hypothetical protein n=1 Tax=Streptomyces sp. NPDC047860 TaxID=3155743 RepID=UPI0033E1F1EE
MDTALAAPRPAAATDSLGRRLVKAVVAGVQERARAGEIPPHEVTEHAVPALPVTVPGLRPVA